MILSRLIDQVGNKHIVSHWKVRRKCQQYHQCTTAMNKYTLVLHFIITSSPTTTTWSLFLNIAYAWIIVPCIFSFPSFLHPQEDTILHKFRISSRIAATKPFLLGVWRNSCVPITLLFYLHYILRFRIFTSNRIRIAK